jgi:hypothetical protein
VSQHARRYDPARRRLCLCGRPALHFSPSFQRFRWAADHALCQRCFRAEVDRQAARQAVRPCLPPHPRLDLREAA